ncbi:acetyl-CoA carboxylase [Burkholderia gladioli]|uniref:Biotin carboxyl carrier protein of acetyl-CoA carboxylase n=1 Tax=Burkholderia gladioli TaxID=28095 RepID=A0AB38TMZ9_BURGA|nr:acetyl-CoA carboxylase [Burkholderia gladioli]MBU9274762.1 biotin carboxyl carrier domain-containing protein [Burkholderia gladioli]PRE18491.1 biotin carboxyl carrier domain-containing protein [Burkholderia gladioli]UWX69128.1 acetyl-CoA carboxylase [Burkholderia gladioli]
MAQHEIVSPLPGTFYRRASLDAAPYVEVGTPVDSDTVVGLVEVMKQFNDVEAGAAGRIAEILAEDGEPVDAGQVLMRIEA